MYTKNLFTLPLEERAASQQSITTKTNIYNVALLIFKMAQNLDLRCVLISDPSILGAGCWSHNTS